MVNIAQSILSFTCFLSKWAKLAVLSKETVLFLVKLTTVVLHCHDFVEEDTKSDISVTMNKRLRKGRNKIRTKRKIYDATSDVNYRTMVLSVTNGKLQYNLISGE